MRPYWGDTLSYSPAGDRLVAVAARAWCQVWNLGTGERLGEVRAEEGISHPPGWQRIDDILVTPDGRDLILTAGGLHSVFVLDADTLEPRWSVEKRGGSAAPIRATLDHAGERIGLSVLHRIVRREGGVDVPGSPAPGAHFRFSPGDEYVVAKSSYETVVLDGETLEVLYRRTELADGASKVHRED